MLNAIEQKNFDDLVASAHALVGTMTLDELRRAVDHQKSNVAGHAPARRRTTGPLPPKSEDIKALSDIAGDNYTAECRHPLGDEPCKLDPHAFDHKPLTVGDLTAKLGAFDPRANLIGPHCTCYLALVPQLDGTILLVEEPSDDSFGKSFEDYRAQFGKNWNFVGVAGLNGHPKIKISVYLDNGVVREYSVSTPISAREHVSAIINTGYRSVEGDKLTHYPPHRIAKVVAQGDGISTSYPDTARGT